jgi:hypothetical protein
MKLFIHIKPFIMMSFVNDGPYFTMNKKSGFLKEPALLPGRILSVIDPLV